MGMYSALLFTSVFSFILLLCTVDLHYLHSWVFGMQMAWQTFWHIVLQHREYYLHGDVNMRLLLAVSALMLLTQRVTSISMDLQDRRLTLPLNTTSLNRASEVLLPVISYLLNFTTLLGGPLSSYSHFVLFMEGIDVNPPPNPLGVVCHKLMQVFILECLRYGFLYVLNYNPYQNFVSGVLCMWALAVGLRFHYYAHWRISECLNNSAGFGYWKNSLCGCPDWNGLSDGDFWITESSSRVSEFARRWNATTASWLRRLVYMRCRYFPLLMTFGFSLWWHGLRMGHFVGFLTWAATVKADHYIHRYWQPKLSTTWTKVLFITLSWINTQSILTCIVIAVELRDVSGLGLITMIYIGVFPLSIIILIMLINTAHCTWAAM